MALDSQASQQMAERFANSPYLGSVQIYDKEETGLGKHRVFYLGYWDLFGVEIPAAGRRRSVEFQLWSREWIKKSFKRLDQHIREGRAGKFIHVRHNIQLNRRAKEHGVEFFRKPKWYRPPEKITTEKKGKLPVRGKRTKRGRRKLKL